MEPADRPKYDGERLLLQKRKATISYGFSILFGLSTIGCILFSIHLVLADELNRAAFALSISGFMIFVSGMILFLREYLIRKRRVNSLEDMAEELYLDRRAASRDYKAILEKRKH